jgi:hypothetical protein
VSANEQLVVLLNGEDTYQHVHLQNGFVLEHKCRFKMTYNNPATTRQIQTAIFTFIADGAAVPKIAVARCYGVTIGKKKAKRDITAWCEDKSMTICSLCTDWPQIPAIEKGLGKFNKRNESFARERQYNKRSNRVMKVGYEIRTPYTVLPETAFTAKKNKNGEWRHSVEEKVTLSLKAVSKEHPGINWGVCMVTGDTNCCKHCGAAYLMVVEPDQTQFHFYGELGWRIARVLKALVDQPCPCPLFEGETQLGYFQRKSFADDENYNDLDLDIKGVTPPTEPKEGQSEADYLAEVAAYPEKCQANLAKLTSDYLETVKRGRELGQFNTSIQVLGMALLTRKIVEVYSYCELLGEYRLVEVITPPDNDGKIMPLLFDPNGKHYHVAIPLQYLANYKIPSDPPKNSNTHFPNGKPRDQILDDKELGFISASVITQRGQSVYFADPSTRQTRSQTSKGQSVSDI